MPAPKIIRDLVEQLENIIETYKQAQSQTQFDRQITHKYSEIDRLRYELYGLSEDEVKVVEGT